MPSSRLFLYRCDMPTRTAYIDALCDIIGCYGYDVNNAAVTAQGANSTDGTSSTAVGASTT